MDAIRKTMNNKCFTVVVLLLFAMCVYGEKDKNIVLYSTHKCKDFYTNDSTDKIFDDILSDNFDKNIEKYMLATQIVENPFDSSASWTFKVAKCGFDSISYYQTSIGHNVAVYFQIKSNKMNLLSKVFIGMPQKDFLDKFFYQYFERSDDNMMQIVDCIHISNISEYNHLYFFFEDRKLVLVEYCCNIFDACR